MTLLSWTNDLDTGIAKIDAEHRKIVDYINELDAVRGSHDRAVVGHVMDELIDYTATHFREEEDMMERAGYPLTEAHRGVHARFVDKVTHMAQQHMAGGDALDDVLQLLENWLFMHIRMNDHGYVETVKAAQAQGRV